MFSNPDVKALPLPERHRRYREIATVFLRLGIVAFGGPAAHIAMMEEELVQKRKWVAREQFMDFLGATNLIPGPNSTEMALHLGFTRGGLAGLVISGVCFILPAALSVLVLAVLYARHGQVRELTGVMDGIKPVVMAVILQALLRLGKTVIKGPLALGAAVLAVGLNLLGISEIPLLLLAGAIVMLVENRSHLSGRLAAVPLMSPLVPPAAGLSMGTSAASIGTAGLFFTFFKIGAFLYGSGYVLLAFLESEFVTRMGVLTNQQLLDAVAVGQFTPGPVFTTATFIGYLLGGYGGAAAATAGIFLPSFVLVFFLNPIIPRLRASKWFSAALDGVNAASLALMAVVSVKLGISSVTGWFTAALAALSLLALLRFRINSFYLILAGGLLGFLYQLVF
ncbi:MAG: chromate efflux transporter [Eubacteriales bacterium]|nr:chromate efflux transporter [Eubacteriales bacterium]MDD3109445.1 chromate efflux transporter [Eubacteriales bacterium]MDD4134112.1 chromate efflux transporter [Eubacteriales bacterium]